MAWSIRPQFLPGIDRECRCSMCGSDPRKNMAGEQERVFNSGVVIDFEGFFSICESCLIEGATLLGYIPPEKAKELGKTNRRLGQENFELKKKVAVLDQLRELL